MKKVENQTAGERASAQNPQIKKPNRQKTVGQHCKTRLENLTTQAPIFGDITKKKGCDNIFVTAFWWELVDSNHRSIKQQIYSLSPLATWESSHIHLLPRAHSLCRSVLDYYSKAAPEMQAFFSIFLRFFQKSLFQTLLRVKTCKRRAPRRGRAGRCKGVFGFGVSEKNRNLYVMASQPCWLSGLDRAIALAWSKAQWL